MLRNTLMASAVIAMVACGPSEKRAKTALPVIKSIEPGKARPGDTLDIRGILFGNSGKVTVGEREVSSIIWSPAALSVQLPADMPAGDWPVVVHVGKLASKPQTLTVVDLTPSAARVDLGAGPFYRDSTLVVHVTGWRNDGGETERYRYSWKVNGSPVAGADSSSFAGGFRKGDSVECDVSPVNGAYVGKTVSSNVVLIANSPPTVTNVTIGTGPYTELNTIVATPGGWRDIDGDSAGYHYQWYDNGVPIVGQTSGSLTGDSFGKGDSVFVQMTPFDGALLGAGVLSNSITILNSPPPAPVIALLPNPPKAGGNLWMSMGQLSNDPDDDTVTYSYAWYKDGVQEGFSDSVTAVPSVYTQAGERWTAVVTPNDGFANGATAWSSAVVVPSKPRIAALSPGSGGTGSYVSIEGNNFGTPGGGTLDIGGQTASILFWSDTHIVAVVPNGLTGGLQTVQVNGVSNVVNFYVTASSVLGISGLSPAAGTGGTTVLLTGIGFGATQTTSAVFFGGIQVTVLAWSDTEIEALVPAQAQPGIISVNVWLAGLASNSLPFDHRRPWLSKVYPSLVTAGDEMTIVGKCLASSTAISIGGVPLQVTAWSDGSATGIVQPATPLGQQAVQTQAPGGGASNTLPVTVRTNDVWLTEGNTPLARILHTAVWTGTQMIVWGGHNGGYLNSGGRYDLATDTWIETSLTSAPTARVGHTAVWTGSKMVVWGGYNGSYLNSGGRYDPATDTWTATSLAGAWVNIRSNHKAVWTGSRMVVFGGYNGIYLNTGGRYDPIADTWTATNNATTTRGGHTAVWTGSRMIAWGGYIGGGNYLNSGARYDPVADTWTATSLTDAPAARQSHTAVWTGSQMVVFGGSNGSYLNSGGRYDPVADSWTATSLTDVPAARQNHTVVWTGTQMVVFGGNNGSFLGSGGQYDPATDAWTATSPTGGPTARHDHTAVWTGSSMLVWGGNAGSYQNTGSRYDPATDTWTATSLNSAPIARGYHSAVWTGSQMVVWGGDRGSFVNSGGRYDPATETWTATSLIGAPTARGYPTAVWTGSQVVVWGGTNGSASYVNSGGRYDPATDTWYATSLTGAPAARQYHTTVWTGSQMAVWGGFNGGFLNSGGLYDPATDLWTATSLIGAPATRFKHTAVWTGTKMVVFGGNNGSVSYLNTGGRYDPALDTWTATSLTGAPAVRQEHTAVWSGSQMIVWGGYNGSNLSSGGRYEPVTDTWTLTSLTGVPAARRAHTAEWTGSRMVVWGGTTGSLQNSGSRYDPAADTWTATSLTGAPATRQGYTALWTGSQMIVWGGYNGTVYLNSMGRYLP